jgi:hypothetical protein
VNPAIPAHTAPLIFKALVVPEHVDPSNLSGRLVIPEHADPLNELILVYLGEYSFT